MGLRLETLGTAGTARVLCGLCGGAPAAEPLSRVMDPQIARLRALGVDHIRGPDALLTVLGPPYDDALDALPYHYSEAQGRSVMKYGNADPRHPWECVEALVDAGIGDVSLVDERGRPPIMRAVIDDIIPVASTLQALVRAGADINTVYAVNGFTPLMFAINHASSFVETAEGNVINLTRAVDACLAAGADPNIVTVQDHSATAYFEFRIKSPLTVAADSMDSAECIDLLLASGARVDVKITDENDTVGSLALQIATRRGNSLIARALLGAGVDIFEARNLELREYCRMGMDGMASGLTLGASALSNAIKLSLKINNWAYIEIVGLLLRAGAPLPTASLVLQSSAAMRSYLDDVLAAGSFEAYERARREPFVEMLMRGGRFPEDIVRVVVDFWVHDFHDKYYFDYARTARARGDT